MAFFNQAFSAIIQKVDDTDTKIMVAGDNMYCDKISTYNPSRTLHMKMEGME